MSMVPLIGFFMIGIILTLFIPCLIVGLWRKRPILSFTTAALILFTTLVAPGLIKTYQAMTIYEAGDPQLMAGGISETIVSAMLSLIFFLPILVLFQWFIRRHFKKKSVLGSTDID